MATKKEREKRRLARDRKLQKEKVSLRDHLQEVDEPVLDIPQDDGPEEVDTIEKSYDKEYEEVPRPTSFSEIDAMREAMEKEQKVRDISYTVGDLVRNITFSPMTPDEKGKAIAKVGSDFPIRVKQALGETMKKEVQEFDMDLLELEALIAKDSRAMTGYEKVANWLQQKAKLTYAAEQKLSDDDFALVYEKDGKKVRKYPIHDKSHLRNALARAAQMIKEGGDAAKDARAALPKIRTAAKKMGIGTMEKSASSVMIEKDLSGKWRAVLVPSNNFMDTDGEILSEASHLEYVDWVNKNMHLAPVFTHWHLSKAVRTHQIDFADYANGFLIMSAPLEEHEAAVLLKAQALCDVGLSHGTLVLERDAQNPKIVTKYRMVEVSDLPLDRAANPFTDFALISKEAEMNRLDYLTELLGPEKAKELLEKSELKQKELREQGVQEKDKAETPAPSSEAPAATPNTPDLETILKAVEERLDVPGLSAFVEQAKEAIEKVPVLEMALKEMTKSTDEALAEKIAPRIANKLSWSRPSQDKGTIVKENDEDDKKLVKSKPEVHWLAEIAGVEPVGQEA